MITLAANDPRSPYEQVRDQISAQIASGELAVGTRLPTVRALATELGIAPNTVAKSYLALERAGLVETHGRGGTRVSANGDERQRLAADAAAEFAVTAKQLGLSRADAEHVIQAALAAAKLT